MHIMKSGATAPLLVSYLRNALLELRRSVE